MGDDRRGLLFATASSFFFSLESLVAKYVDLPPIVLSWYGVFGLTLLSAPLSLSTKWSISPKAAKLIALRSVMGTFCLITMFSAVEYLPLGDAAVLMYLAPVFTTVLAHLFLKEPCTAGFVLGIVVILCGVVLVTEPPLMFADRQAPPEYYYGVVLALTAALTESVSNVAIRELTSVHYSVIMFTHGGLSLAFTSALIPFTDWSSAPSTPLLPLLLALFSALEQLMNTLALSVEHAGPVALVQASDIIFGYMYQILFFGEEVKTSSLLGAGLIAVVVYKLATTKQDNERCKKSSISYV